jgi:hypothetical protein
MAKGCLGEFLRTGESWRWLGDPRSKNVRQIVFSHGSPSSFFADLALHLRAGTRNLPVARHSIVRENHANARKISQFQAVSGRKWKSEIYDTRKKRGGGVTNEAWRRWHESGCKESTMERLFGVKIFRAAVRSRGEVGIVAEKLR